MFEDVTQQAAEPAGTLTAVVFLSATPTALGADETSWAGAVVQRQGAYATAAVTTARIDIIAPGVGPLCAYLQTGQPWDWVPCGAPPPGTLTLTGPHDVTLPAAVYANAGSLCGGITIVASLPILYVLLEQERRRAGYQPTQVEERVVARAISYTPPNPLLDGYPYNVTAKLLSAIAQRDELTDPDLVVSGRNPSLSVFGVPDPWEGSDR